MCRYAMTSYKHHYACFNCRKTFKRRLLWDINRDDKREFAAKCPQCAELMANMGLDFASPKKNDMKAWDHLKTLYAVGITFHSCGCSGPGYIPNDKKALIAYFEGMKQEYLKQLKFWRERVEPTNKREIDKDMSENWEYINQVPGELRPKKG